MRLAAQMRGGFYPAHERAVAHAATLLRAPAGQPFAILDPCAGQGAAIRQLAEQLGCPPEMTFAIELDESRAAAVHAALPGAQVLAPANFFGCRASRNSFSFVWLNPPFDTSLGGHRVEDQFLHTATEWLLPGGVMALVCPEDVVDEYSDARRHFATYYENCRIVPFPADCRRFEEVIVLGHKRARPTGESGKSRDGDAWEAVQAPRHFLYQLPAGTGPRILEKVEPTDPELQRLLANSPLRSHLMAPPPIRLPSPPLPLGVGHVALLLAGGHLDGVVCPDGQPPHVVRGTSRSRHLMDKAVFLNLSEVADDLPPLEEECLALRMDAELATAYRQEVEQPLAEAIKAMLRRKDRRLLGAMLQTLLAYPDYPFGWGQIGSWQAGEEGTPPVYVSVAQPPNLAEAVLHPKEKALIELVRSEKAQSRKVWAYVQYTDKHDVQGRLERRLRQAGFQVGVLAAQVPLDRREDWIARQAPRLDVVLSHPRLQLRGDRGELVATDGRQLLVQGGFSFPWKGDVLVPATGAFGCRELPQDTWVALGRTDTQVGVRVGPWTFLLAIDKEARFPRVDNILPARSPGATICRLSPEDARFLAQALPRLPGRGDDKAPITIDLNGSVAVRAAAEAAGRVTEVVLNCSEVAGPPVRFVSNRLYLARAVQLGFTEFAVTNPDVPVACREQRRTYGWMPLGKEGALSPGTDALRIASHPEDPLPQPETQRRNVAMTTPPDNGHGNGPAAPRRDGAATEDPTPNGNSPGALIEEAQALKDVLHEAYGRTARLVAALRRHRKQSKLVQTTLASLRQLQEIGRQTVPEARLPAPAGDRASGPLATEEQFMPLKLNVGASRKVSDNHYGSRGASVNLELELDASLIREPTRLQERIRQLFSLVRVSLTEELNGGNGHHAAPELNNSAPLSRPPASAKGGGSQRNGGKRPATPAQVKALYAISREQGLDLHELLRDQNRVERPEELTLRQASSLIDELRSSGIQPGP